MSGTLSCLRGSVGNRIDGSSVRGSLPELAGALRHPHHHHPPSAPRGRNTLEVAEGGSPEEAYHRGPSHSSHRSLTRPHTPVGRIDVLPSHQPMGNGYLQIPQVAAGPLGFPGSPTLLPTGESPWNYYTATSPTGARGPAQSRLPSRPQTPASRLDVLPSEEHFSFPPGKPHSTQRSQQRSPGLIDRMTLGAPEEMDFEGLTATLPSRCYRPCPRMSYRSHSPVDRITILHRDRSTDRSLCRHRGTSSGFTQLPPRPPPSPRSCLSPLLPSVRRLSIAHSVNGAAPEIFQEFAAEPVRMAESEVDVLLTRLCGQDRILQGLVAEATPLKTEKDRLEGALEVIRCQLLDFGGQQNLAKKLMCQQRILQEELIQIRARLCDLSMEMEQAWNEYELLENELERLRAPRELMSRCGSPQERGEAQRDLWMMQDVMLGLRNNKKNFQVAIESTRHPATSFVASPMLDHHSELQVDSRQCLSPLQSPSSRQLPIHREPPPGEDDAPCRPPLPQMPYHDECSSSVPETEAASLVAPDEQKLQEKGDVQYDPVTNGKVKGQLTLTVGSTGRRGRMSAEEQMERMKRHLQARGQDKARAGRPAQRSVVMSPIVRGPLTEQKAGTPGRRSRTPLTKRPQTSHLSGAQLTAGAPPSRTSPANSPTVATQAAATEMPGTPNLVASSKHVTKIVTPPTRVESQTRENNRVVRKECKPNKVAITSRYIDVDPDPPLSPEQLQEKQQTLEAKTVITQTS
ncbi:pleckstrin homology domain-containing family A member 7-like isoform X2 [Pristis pectinata]|nr:pleckstrin homology domain-containing family A member 7-like isoform X2 [Pristis pectinata]